MMRENSRTEMTVRTETQIVMANLLIIQTDISLQLSHLEQGKGGDCRVTLYFELTGLNQIDNWNTFSLLSSSFGLSDKIRLLLMLSAQLMHPMIRDVEYLNRSISEYSDEIKYWCISYIDYISPDNWIGKWIMCCPLIEGWEEGPSLRAWEHILGGVRSKFESMRAPVHL